MSETFFHFTVECPHCHCLEERADGWETDDWTEVFVFSGKSPRSARPGSYEGFRCSKCGRVTDIDELYDKKLVRVESIERVKAYLFGMVNDVIERPGLPYLRWEPDIETAIRRYAALYPDDPEWIKLKMIYRLALHAPRALTKFEPRPGTQVILPDMIVYKATLKKVYLPDGLIEIGDDTFCDCGRLSDVFIPRTVVRIGRRAFKDCRNLRKVHSPDNLQRIEEEAFCGCRELESFYFPGKLEHISERSFCGCEKLRSAFIPESCREIGRDAFLGCPNLVIRGKSGSLAEAYARDNGLPFAQD